MNFHFYQIWAVAIRFLVCFECHIILFYRLWVHFFYSLFILSVFLLWWLRMIMWSSWTTLWSIINFFLFFVFNFIKLVVVYFKFFFYYLLLLWSVSNLISSFLDLINFIYLMLTLIEIIFIFILFFTFTIDLFFFLFILILISALQLFFFFFLLFLFLFS